MNNSKALKVKDKTFNYQENWCLRKITRNEITNVFSHTTELNIIKPLVCMKVSKNT
ncbi:predicted protein [Arabidopsis lyrata subsp. lyrata]|uniref:Predicted protein n=1 Tax=Arabidopsis lyrata subsp. lyrata TaxID=81972 RepID=D7MET7_ARALL|nr:predicted protein [Arabidopsis lyrata subsp. lyrata]